VSDLTHREQRGASVNQTCGIHAPHWTGGASAGGQRHGCGLLPLVLGSLGAWHPQCIRHRSDLASLCVSFCHKKRIGFETKAED
jgi:hypothetical protein